MHADDLQLLCSLGTPALHPDGSHAVVAVTHPDLEADAYAGQLWRVDLETAEPPRRLTTGTADSAPAFSPDGRWLAFLRTVGEAPPQLHLLPTAGGDAVVLTEAPLGVGAFEFSPDGRRLAYLARVPAEGRYLKDGKPQAEAPRYITSFTYRHDDVGFTFDRPRQVFVLPVPDGLDTGRPPEPVRLTDGVDVTGLAWTADSAAVLCTTAVSGASPDTLANDLLRVPAVDAGAVPPAEVLVDGATRRLSVEQVLADPDGVRTWLLAADCGPGGREFIGVPTRLWSLDPGGAPVPVSAESTELEAGPGRLLAVDGEILVAAASRGAVHLLAVAPDGTERELLGGPVVVGAAAAAAGRVVATVSDATTAGDLEVLAAGTWNRRTDFSAPLRATGRLHTPREFTATAPDGYPVHGWVAVPEPADGGGTPPTLLLIHGGPEAQYTHALFDEVQVAVQAGYAVVLCNPRGSSGYGSDHARAIHRGFGTVDAVDVLAFLDAALAAFGLDGQRVGVMGGSYGGYMTAWLTTQTDRFAAAVVERGFLDPVSFVGSSDIGWVFGLEYLGDAYTDPQAVAAQSPMAQVDAVRTPTLVIHSEQDWRCPVEQGQRWYVELKRRGVPTALLLFPGEGHELTRSGNPVHRRQRFEHVLAWWAEHLPVTPG